MIVNVVQLIGGGVSKAVFLECFGGKHLEREIPALFQDAQVCFAWSGLNVVDAQKIFVIEIRNALVFKIDGTREISLQIFQFIRLHIKVVHFCADDRFVGIRIAQRFGYVQISSFELCISRSEKFRIELIQGRTQIRVLHGVAKLGQLIGNLPAKIGDLVFQLRDRFAGQLVLLQHNVAQIGDLFVFIGVTG